jgi:hypothetical protein
MTAVAETVAAEGGGAPLKGGNAFRIDREGDLAIIWFDLPGEKVNKFSSAVMMEFAAIVDEM